MSLRKSNISLSAGQNNTEAFKLKMRSLTLPILQILDSQLEVIEEQLEDVKIKTPNLFQCSPMVLDLESISTDLASLQVIDLIKLCEMLRLYGIIPVGIQGANAFYEDEAQKAGMPIFSIPRHESHYKSMPTESPVISSRESERPVISNGAKLITKPIRSGQQVYAEGADLIILASVSQGAELLADGHIHVYGTLRGRALAGIQGNREARIFCHNLEADLVSIAGYYMISEVIDRHRKIGAQQIYLEDEKLHINSL